MEILTEKKQAEKFKTIKLNIRSRNFSNNIPFLILSDKLPDDQAYLEYADGHIEISETYANGAEIKSRLIRILSKAEANKIRKDNGLL